MTLSFSYAALICVRQLRGLGRRAISLQQPCSSASCPRRYSSIQLDVPMDSPKIAAIVDQIGKLTLLETADLVASLKLRLKIPDLPMGGFAIAAPAGLAPADEPIEEEPVAAKTLFLLKLVSFEAASKAKIIKEVKSLLGLSLVDSKKFVESAPKTLKENVPKDDADKIIATMKDLGAVVTME